MKFVCQIATVFALCLATPIMASDADEPDLTVPQPLTAVEKSCAAQLTRLPSARMWWNERNRIVGVNLKGKDASNRAVALAGQLPGMRALVLVALPQNRLNDNCLAPLASHPALRLLSVSGGRLSDAALAHIPNISTLEVLILNGNFTDAAMPLIATLSNLTYLDLTQCHVTDAGLVHLPKLPNLQTLTLNGTPISNECLPSIVELKRLSELYLGDTSLDDGAIEQLKKLEQLEVLFIKGTGITESGFATLVAALPSTCKVIHDSGSGLGERVPRTAALTSDVQLTNGWRAAR